MIAEIKIPEPFDSEIKDLAVKLAETMENLSAASQRVTTAELCSNTVNVDYAELFLRRRNINDRRAAGHHELGGTFRLTFIEASLVSLNEMRLAVDAEVREARTAFDAVNALAARLRWDIATAEAKAALAVLITHAEAVQQRDQLATDLADSVLAVDDERSLRAKIADLDKLISGFEIELAAAEAAEAARRRSVLEAKAREIYEESHRQHAAKIRAFMPLPIPTAIKEFSI